MVRRTIKRQLSDILREVYTELNFPSEATIVCSSKSTGQPLPPSALFFVFDELATLYDALGNVGKYTSVAALSESVAKAISPDIAATIVNRGREVSSRNPLQTIMARHHNVKNISEVRDQVAAQLGLPATFAITLTSYSKVRDISKGFATLGLRCYLRKVAPDTMAESFREELYRRICVSGELRLTNSDQELRGRLGDIIDARHSAHSG
jgi:hypothetical protein